MPINQYCSLTLATVIQQGKKRYNWITGGETDIIRALLSKNRENQLKKTLALDPKIDLAVQWVLKRYIKMNSFLLYHQLRGIKFGTGWDTLT